MLRGNQNPHHEASLRSVSPWCCWGQHRTLSRSAKASAKVTWDAERSEALSLAPRHCIDQRHHALTHVLSAHGSHGPCLDNYVCDRKMLKIIITYYHILSPFKTGVSRNAIAVLTSIERGLGFSPALLHPLPEWPSSSGFGRRSLGSLRCWL